MDLHLLDKGIMEVIVNLDHHIQQLVVVEEEEL